MFHLFKVEVYEDFLNCLLEICKTGLDFMSALTKVPHNGATCPAHTNFTIPQNVAKLYVVNTKFTLWLTQSSAILQLNCNC